MKVLYAIQGTGNGHLSRAEEIVPILNKNVDTTVLVSSSQSQITSNFEINYKRKGLTFLSGKNGKVNLLNTIFKSHPIDFLNEIRTFPIWKYDLVITDFEPVSAWSALMHGVPCIEMSHQAAVIHPKAPKPTEKNLIGKYILNHYCPSNEKIGFHFEAFDKSIYTPVIRKEILDADAKNQDYYTVYLPAFNDEAILHFLSQFPVKWEVYSKYTTIKKQFGNVHFNPINQLNFQKSLINCTGVLCGAGFELPAEAIYLRKKLMVIPMQGQYEQECNAFALMNLGVTVIDNLNLVNHRTLNLWLNFGENIVINYENQTEEIVLNTLNTFEEKLKLRNYSQLSSEKTIFEKLSVLKYLF
jgi:uncharacterized protein (TIGR00661 family)